MSKGKTSILSNRHEIRRHNSTRKFDRPWATFRPLLPTWLVRRLRGSRLVVVLFSAQQAPKPPSPGIAGPVVPENQLEAYAVLTAMGPTYTLFQWQKLEELAQSFGIPADQARSGIKTMLMGALAVYFDAGLTVNEVCDLIPVRPLKEDEPAIQAMLEQRLTAILQKIKP